MRSFRRDHPHRPHEARRGDRSRWKQAAKDVKHGRPGNRVDRVEAAGNLRIGAGKIDHRAAARWVVAHGYANGNRARTRSVIVEKILAAPFAGRQFCENRLHQSFRTAHHGFDPSKGVRMAETIHEFADSFYTDAARAQLGGQVTLTLARRAHIGQQDLEHLAVHRATMHQFHGRDANAFLRDLAAKSHGARNMPPTSAWWARFAT